MRYCTIHSTTATFRSPVSMSASARVSGVSAKSALGSGLQGAEAELHLELALHGDLW